MSAKRLDHTHPQSEPLDLPQLDALLRIYREALDELRSWHDPHTTSLIMKLEALLLKAARDRRYLMAKRHTLSLL
jgi:hypothetical protein